MLLLASRNPFNEASEYSEYLEPYPVRLASVTDAIARLTRSSGRSGFAIRIAALLLRRIFSGSLTKVAAAALLVLVRCVLEVAPLLVSVVVAAVLFEAGLLGAISARVVFEKVFSPCSLREEYCCS